MVSVADALALWQRGFSVIPVPRPDGRHDGKVPAIPWKGYQTRRATEAEVRAWFADPQNVAIVTGAISGVVVIDADGPEALTWATRHLPYSPWQVRTTRGYHLFYSHPGEPVRNRARLDTGTGRLALDVRGDGGFVIGPGSAHASGHRYTAGVGWHDPPDAVPVFDPAWLAGPARPVTRPPAVRRTSEAATRARRYLAAIPKPEIGHGSDTATLYAAARLVRGFALPEAEAVALLDDWAGGRPGWDRDWLAAKVRHAVRYGTEPIGGRL